MIKYVELTAPQSSAFRQAKIISIECKENDYVQQGSTLFMVKSGEREIALPATSEGRVVEIIATADESITLSTALVLLETEVEGSTATPPIIEPESEPKPDANIKSDQSQTKKNKSKKRTKQKASKSKKSKTKRSSDSKPDPTNSNPATAEQQDLDLLAENFQLTQEVAPSSKPKHKPTPTQAKPAAPSKTMSANSIINVTVPDIGADSAKVIEILVQVGDTIAVEDPLVTLESDKASMDVPSTHAGTISAVKVEIDQEVSEGTLLIELSSEDNASAAKPTAAETTTEKPAEPATAAASGTGIAATTEVEVAIPDIGGDSAKVTEILVTVGDTVALEDPLLTLESDKASMEVPSSAAGEVTSIEVSLDQDVQQGVVIVKILSADTPAAPNSAATTEKVVPETSVKPSPAEPENSPAVSTNKPPAAPADKSHASPSIRRFARELGADLSRIGGSGRKGRITKDDVKGFVKGVMTGNTAATAAASGGTGIQPIPTQDFSKFGEIEVQPLNKIKRLTASNLHRAWLNVPHVTHHDESNINDLESFRKELNAEFAKQDNGVKLSPLAFVVRAVVSGLRKFPQFNSSLDETGDNLILKKYINIGIAVETPNGLVVPVLKNADKLSVTEIAKEMSKLAAKARDKKLTMADMSGACFTISSLGGIGGTGFTPIVNAPEVAILGVSRSKIAPVWNGSEFKPGMMLPLSLSYDHRVIDGAEAARFTRHVAAALEDVRRLTL